MAIATWPRVASAPTGAPRPPRPPEPPRVTTWASPIVAAAARDLDGDACAPDATPRHDPLSDRVEVRRRGLETSLAPALFDNLGGRVRAASIEHGVPAPEFGWPSSHDVRFATAMTMAIRALECGNFHSAIAFATRAAQWAESDPLAPIVGALAAARLRDPDLERDLLNRAHRLAPEDPAVTRALAIALSTGPDLSRALDACDTVLGAGPDPEIARLRARIGERTRTFAGGSRETEEDLTVIGTTPRPDVRDLVRAVDMQIAALIGTHRRGALVIYVYPDRASFQRGTCTTRDAAFDGAVHVLASSLDTPRGRSHARHQTAHAALSTIAPDAPAWLIEGIADRIAQPQMAGEHAGETWILLSELADPAAPLTDPAEVGLAYEVSRTMTTWLASRPNGLTRALTDPDLAIRGLASGGLAIEDVPDAFPDTSLLASPAGVADARLARREIAMLNDTHSAEPERVSAASSLGDRGASCAGIATLTDRLVHDWSPDVRRACARALGRLGHADARDSLRWASTYDADDDVREVAREALSSEP